jgi:hypothetical protein
MWINKWFIYSMKGILIVSGKANFTIIPRPFSPIINIRFMNFEGVNTYL